MQKQFAGSRGLLDALENARAWDVRSYATIMKTPGFQELLHEAQELGEEDFECAGDAKFPSEFDFFCRALAKFIELNIADLI